MCEFPLQNFVMRFDFRGKKRHHPETVVLCCARLKCPELCGGVTNRKQRKSCSYLCDSSLGKAFFTRHDHPSLYVWTGFARKTLPTAAIALTRTDVIPPSTFNIYHDQLHGPWLRSYRKLQPWCIGTERFTTHAPSAACHNVINFTRKFSNPLE